MKHIGMIYYFLDASQYNAFDRDGRGTVRRTTGTAFEEKKLKITIKH